MMQSRKHIFIGAFFVGLVINICAGLIYIYDGLPQRLPAQAIIYASGQNDFNPRREECHQPTITHLKASGPCVVVHDSDAQNYPFRYISFGDSFSNTLMPVLKDLGKKFHINGWQTSFSSCPPLWGVERYRTLGGGYQYPCRAFNEEVFNLITKNNIDNVILFARWSAYENEYVIGKANAPPPITMNESRENFHTAIQNTIISLTNRNIHLWIILQPPEYPFNVPQALSRTSLTHGDPLKLGMSKKIADAQNHPLLSILSKIPSQNTALVHVIDLNRYLCQNDKCKVEDSGHSLYRDESHLSVYGIRYLEALFLPMFKGLSNHD